MPVQDQSRAELVAELARLQAHFEHQALTAMARPPTGPALTAQQARMVAVVAIEQGRATSQGLARRMGISLATVSGIVDRLVDHGVVRRQEDPEDRRVRRLQVTEEGRELIADLLSGVGMTPLPLMEQLALADLRALVQGLGAVQDAAARMGGCDRPVRDEGDDQPH